MSNEITVYRNVVDPLAYMREVGAVIAKSRMFGCETIEQGQALVVISMTEQLPMLELRRRYHIIQGDLTMRAEFMRAELRRLGGDYDWLDGKDGEDGVEARLWIEFKGRRREVGYTIEHAKKEGLVKKGSRWEKDPGSMLRARCTSKAVKMVASEVLAGFCTDEDMGYEENENGNGHAAAPAKTQVASHPAAAQSDVVDAEFEVSGDPAPDGLPPDAPAVDAAVPPVNGACTSAQSTRIKELWGILEATPEQRDKILAKRKAAAVRNLTGEQAGDVIATRENLAAMKANAEKAFSETSAELVARIKTRLAEVNQTHPGTIDKFKAKLKASGLAKISDLPREHAMSLLSAMEGLDLEAYLGVAIWPAPERAVAADPKN